MFGPFWEGPPLQPVLLKLLLLNPPSSTLEEKVWIEKGLAAIVHLTTQKADSKRAWGEGAMGRRDIEVLGELQGTCSSGTIE